MLRLVRSFAKTANRGRSADGFLLPPDRFELAATAERMRVDRNGSLVSLLLVEPAKTKNTPADILDLERFLAARLRLTDTAGWLRSGRIGLLLPDTPESGAWKVASDLCETYSTGADRPTCEVVVYPEGENRTGSPDGDDDLQRANRSGPGSLAGASSEKNSFFARSERTEGGTIRVDAAEPVVRPTISRATVGLAGVNYDSLLTRPLPLWKRSVDLLGSSLGLLIASPLIGLGALAVLATSKGPAFFVQEREGLGGRRFRMYKLRTMWHDAEHQKETLRESSEQDGPAFKMVNDPRVTPLGRLLRKTSIDELPQLWNVLVGDMSLVGPRPLPVDESLACLPWQRRRLYVTPGLTCTWQIHGRNVVPFDEWIRMDLDYARRRSPWLDLKLVAQTGPSVILQKGR